MASDLCRSAAPRHPGVPPRVLASCCLIAPAVPRQYPGSAPMGSGPHGSTTGVLPGYCRGNKAEGRDQGKVRRRGIAKRTKAQGTAGASPEPSWAEKQRKCGIRADWGSHSPEGPMQITLVTPPGEQKAAQTGEPLGRTGIKCRAPSPDFVKKHRLPGCSGFLSRANWRDARSAAWWRFPAFAELEFSL